MDKEFKIIVDSTADFEEGYENENVVILKTPVYIGHKEFTYATPDEFYDRQREVFAENEKLRGIGQFPISIKTSTPSPGAIEEATREILAEGKDAVYATMASTLSSTFQSARIACEDINDSGEFKNRAICIDSLCMSAAGSMLIRTAVEKCNTTDEVMQYLFDRRNDVVHYFAFDNFAAMVESGRYSATTMAIAQLVGIKALMRFDFLEDGTRKPFCERKALAWKVLCKKAALSMRDTIDGNSCIVLHAQNPDGAKMLTDTIRQTAPEVEILTGSGFRMGPAVGVHLGFSAIGLIFMRRKGLDENAELHRELVTPEESFFGYEFPENA